ncbi:YjgB family protein [Shimazuella sp. AN120528]|uniref:DUF4309 domain-containing protein n=1 Tax=Shimazuella soli TaxID=1892854 RepID=UPI001F111F0C|nr:DUF4309 domain-containing protein [Shimazuella soli]MCH5585602.1 YjgB family protein [Shimazuella soli]
MNKSIKTIIATTFTVGTLLAGISQISYAYASPITSTQHQNTQQQNHQKLIKQTKQLAAEGKVINSESFGLGSTRNAIVKKWGKPEDSDANTLFYEKRKILFELKANKVTSVDSLDKRFQSINEKEVRQALGKPNKVKHYEDGTEVYYKAGKHTLRFVFGTNVDVIVD